MNEAMPPWRSFPAEPPGPQRQATEQRRREGGGSAPRWLVPALAGLTGLALGAVAAALALVLLVAPPGSDPLAGFGDPLPELGALDGLPLRDEPEEPATEIVVDIAGAVARPGLHRLWAGARVGDALSAAGGYAPRADLVAASVALNLAQPLEDGMKVLVPELGASRPESGGSAAGDGRIDLNQADQAELESLPGIGPVTAGKIMAARAERRFRDVGELRTRSLVGDSVFEDIEDLVRVG